MSMKREAQKILEEALNEAPGDRGRVTFYLSKAAVKQFKNACGPRKASRVLERLIRAFSQGRAA